MFLEDYDIDIAYHPVKVNVVIDTMSRRPVVCVAKLSTIGIKYEDQREGIVD